MHGDKETSNFPRLACTIIHLLFLIIAGWVYFGGWFNDPSAGPGDVERRIILFSFGIILFLRMTLGLFYLLQRKFGWDELGGVLFALFLYQVVFAVLGGGETKPPGLLDVAAIVLFVFGSCLNTGSELQRKKFKDQPPNQGKLYTQGLFRFARHINYFGDVLWVTAWAVVTGNIWALMMPLFLTALFIFFFIPSLTTHLKSRYAGQFNDWAQNTKALIPYIY